MQPSVKVPGPRKALIVPRDSSWPLLQRQAREKELETAHETHKLLCGRLWCLQLLCSGKDQQRFSFSRKVRAQTNPQLRVSSLQKMAEDTFFLFFFFLFFPEIKTIS